MSLGSRCRCLVECDELKVEHKHRISARDERQRRVRTRARTLSASGRAHAMGHHAPSAAEMLDTRLGVPHDAQSTPPAYVSEVSDEQPQRVAKDSEVRPTRTHET